MNLINYFIELKDKMEYYNNLSPFPIYDTGYIKYINIILRKMKTKEYYDSLPVEACKFCKRLKLQEDELKNVVCMSCGAVNEFEKYENIFEYKEKNNIE